MSVNTQVVIRGRNADDWRAIAAICRTLRPEFNPLEIPYPSDDYAREKIGKAPDNTTSFGLVAEWDGKLVGEISLARQHGRCRHVGRITRLVVDPMFQGQGVGGLLLNAMIDLAEHWVNLSRVENTIHIDNAPGIALHRRHGFVIEGRMRDYVFHDGRYVDAYVVARVRDAF